MTRIMMDQGYIARTIAVILVLTAMGIPAPFSVSAAETPAFEWGFDHRARYVDFDNILDYRDTMDDENRFFRFRTRLWGTLTLENLEFKLQLANEFRHYSQPDLDDSYDEIFVDQCYLKLNDLFGSGWYLSAGRQNIMKREGFILFDGSPLDGSRSIYFNSIVAGRSFGNMNLEFLGISNPYKDKYFPRIGDKSKPLIEHNEYAGGVYLTYNPATSMSFEVTYLYKQEDCPEVPENPWLKPDRELHIAGGRLDAVLGDTDTLSVEFGGEYGEIDPDKTITAWAGHAAWKHTFPVGMNPVVKLSGGAFSGDDPDTDDDEGWTPPFSRWPRWSELYIYSLARERGVAFWSNLYFAGAECVMAPVKPLTVRLTYYRLYAFESRGDCMVFCHGKTRGDLFQVRADLKLPKGFSGHALYEYLRPGSFYAGDDAGHFLRFELNYRFSHRILFGA